MAGRPPPVAGHGHRMPTNPPRTAMTDMNPPGATVRPDSRSTGTSRRRVSRRGPTARRVFSIAVPAAAVIAAVAALPGLRSVKSDIRSIEPRWVIAAILLELASCISFVAVFRAFFDRVPAKLARRVAWFEEGSGALLPGGGLTSYAAGGLVLRREGLPVEEIIVRSGGVFWLTSAVNFLALLIATVLLLAGDGRHTGGNLGVILPAAVATLLALGVAASAWIFRERGTVRAWRPNPLGGVAQAWRVARTPGWRLLGAFGYLGFDMAVLACLFRGLGYSVPFGVLGLGYLVGYCATLIPIPGGIGVLEGGLTGALVLYGTPPAKTAAAVLVYHAIAFWIPSIGGSIAYASLLRRRSDNGPRRVALGRRSGVQRCLAAGPGRNQTSKAAPVSRHRDG